MEKNSNTNSRKLLYSLITLVCVLTLILTLCQCSNTLSVREPITEEEYITLADELQNSVDANCNKKYYYVSDYLLYWNFPAFDVDKLRTVERYYAQKYYVDLGYSNTSKIYERARLTAEAYIETKLLDENGECLLTLEQINNKSTNTDNLILSYISTIGDRYSAYYNVEEFDAYISDLNGSFAGIGVYVELDKDAHTVTVLNTLPDSAAEAAGILPGDLLYKIDGKQIDDYELDVFMDFAKGEIGSPVSVTVIRDGAEIVFNMNRVPIEEASVEYVIFEGGIAYIYVSSFNANTDEQFIQIMDTLEAEEEVKGYIFDVRYNGGGYVDTAVNILSYFVPKGTKIVLQGTKTYSYWHNSLTDHVVTRPIVVLCNGYTASAAELFTAAIRDYRDMGLLNAKIVGEKTYSKGKMQTIYDLSDGSAIVLTTGLFNPPCNVNFDGEGVTPDAPVEFIPNPETDNQFEAALEEMKKMINNN